MKAICKLAVMVICIFTACSAAHLTRDSEKALWGQVKKIKETIKQWHAACGKGDFEKLEKLYLAEKDSTAREDLAELRGLTEKISELKLEPAVIIWDDKKAIVMSDEIEGLEGKRVRSMTWHFERSGEAWQFFDRVDGSAVGMFGDTERDLLYIRYYVFIDKFPTGHMWLNVRDAKEELVSNSRVEQAASFMQMRWKQLDDAPADVRRAAEVTKEFIAACMAQDEERAKRAFRPDAGKKVDEATKQMNRFLAAFDEWQFSPMVIELGKRDKEVISHPIVFPDYGDGGGDQGVVKVEVARVEDEWRVNSVSAGSLKGVPEDYGYFYRRNPGGLIWCDAAAANWIKPELQPKVETFAKDIIAKYVKSEPKEVPLDRFREGLYDANVFESYFPDDKEASKQLDAWVKARYPKGGRWPDTENEAVELYRKGLRRSTVKYRGNTLMQSLGGAYVWRTEPYNEAALELMYHASYDREFINYSVYSGMSAAKPKPAKVLRRLAEIAMAYKQMGRIFWGVKSSVQQEEFEAVVKSYLDDSDPEVRDRADIVLKALSGDIDARKWEGQWSSNLAAQRIEALYGDELPVIKELLLKGTSFERRQLLDYARRKGIHSAFDETWREALIICLHDGNPFVREHAIQLGGRMLCEPEQENDRILKLMDKLSTDVDHKVREAVAVFVGSYWVWEAKPQVPKAIEIMQRLARDSSREVRNNAVYYGLSVLEHKDEETIAFLVDLAMDPYRQADVGRIAWGLRGGADKETIRACVKPFTQLKNGKGERARKLYKDVFKEEPSK